MLIKPFMGSLSWAKQVSSFFWPVRIIIDKSHYSHILPFSIPRFIANFPLTYKISSSYTPIIKKRDSYQIGRQAGSDLKQTVVNS